MYLLKKFAKSNLTYFYKISSLIYKHKRRVINDAKNITPIGINDEVSKTVINQIGNIYSTFLFISPSGDVLINEYLNENICIHTICGGIIAIIDNQIQIIKHHQVLYLNFKKNLELRNNTTENVVIYIGLCQ